MEIDRTEGRRFEAALELFRSGTSVVFHGVGFRLEGPRNLVCVVPSSWRPENLTEERALVQFQRADAALTELRAQSPAFVAAIQGREVVMELVDEYRMGAVLLCRRTSRGLAWTKGFPRAAPGR